MPRAVLLPVLVVLAWGTAAAQQPPAVSGAPLQFDVASIRRHVPGDLHVGRAVEERGVVRLPFISAAGLVRRAFPGTGAFSGEVLNLPAWATTEVYEVIARGKPDVTGEELRQMFQALLEERMKLKAHYEMRDRESYDLVFVRDDRRPGPGLRPSTVDCSNQPEPPIGFVIATVLNVAPDARTPRLDSLSDQLRADALKRCMLTQAGNHLVAGGATLDVLARFLRGAAGRPVINRTGLTGRYAIDVTFATAPSAVDTDAAPSLRTALREQLGLRLEPSRTQVEVLVVDHLERPTDH